MWILGGGSLLPTEHTLDVIVLRLRGFQQGIFPTKCRSQTKQQWKRNLESMMAALSPDFGSHSLVPAILSVLGAATTSYPSIRANKFLITPVDLVSLTYILGILNEQMIY